MSQIHPTAIIEEGVELGCDCTIHALAVLRRGTMLGDRVVVHPGAVLGGEPQDLKFDPATVSGVRIGHGTVVREHVTVHRSTKPGGFTSIGENCLLMASCHVAHDCTVGNQVVVANIMLMAGHVTVGDHAFLSGGSVIHQFVRIGEGVMLGGMAGVGLGMPPFKMAARRNELVGLNLVGLRRRGCPRESIRELKAVYRYIYYTPGNLRELAARALAGGEYCTPEARRFLEFFGTGKRGFLRPRRGAAAGGGAEE